MEHSYEATERAFRRGNLEVHDRGVSRLGSDRVFSLVAEDFKVIKVVGRGASGSVAQGVHVPSNTILAIKRIPIQDKQKRDSAIREIQALYNCTSSALIGFYGAFYENGCISILLEYMDGGSLQNVIDQVGSVPENALANISYQVLEGLSYLKRDGRVHRDIKPANILINSQGFIKLTDFGLSKDVMNSIAKCATFVGSFLYMSPERIESKAYSFPSDVWSLGLVIYECAMGAFPYEPAHTSSVFAFIGTLRDYAPPELPIESPDHNVFSPYMRHLVSRCLQRNPEKRDSVEQLLQHPALAANGATDLQTARVNVERWIQS